jgi:UDPglucose 6-dehydrogenase
LTNEGAHVRVYDPKVKDEDLWMELDRLNCDPQRKYVTTHRDMYSAAEDCDAIVVCTEWDEFKVCENVFLFVLVGQRSIPSLNFILHL